jgi:hypothetical protein
MVDHRLRAFVPLKNGTPAEMVSPPQPGFPKCLCNDRCTAEQAMDNDGSRRRR